MSTFPSKNEMRRAFLGHYVAHMTDEQLDTFMEPYERLADRIIADKLDKSMPKWWLKMIAEERGRLLRVLARRAGQQ